MTARAMSLVDSLLIQKSVLRALILRELQARFGRDNIGFLWTVAEPMMLASVITTFHYISRFGAVEGSGMGPYPFTLIGYCLFMIFRNNFNKAEGAIPVSVSLMYHAHIMPLDIMISRVFVETVGALLALVLLMALGIALGLAELPARPLYLLAAIAAISIWTFGLGLIIAGNTYDSHLLSRFVHPTSYFMLPLSGAFVTLDFLPSAFRGYLAWNPMVSMFELARYGQFVSASDRYVFPAYIIAHCVLAFCLGLVSMRRLRGRIHVG